MDAIAEHEHSLLRYVYDRMKRINRIRLYGPTGDLSNKVGAIPFTVEGMHHALVAAILSAEGGIGVRNGFFCAQPYVKRLLGMTKEEELEAGCGVGDTDRTATPGMVRASLGCYSNEEDVDRFLEMLERIVRNEYKGKYSQEPASGAFQPEGFRMVMDRYFSFFESAGEVKDRTYSEAS
jgi:selenocysteine lyase/cysteine desulfurase